MEIEKRKAIEQLIKKHKKQIAKLKKSNALKVTELKKKNWVCFILLF